MTSLFALFQLRPSLENRPGFTVAGLAFLPVLVGLRPEDSISFLLPVSLSHCPTCFGSSSSEWHLNSLFSGFINWTADWSIGQSIKGARGWRQDMESLHPLEGEVQGHCRAGERASQLLVLDRLSENYTLCVFFTLSEFSLSAISPKVKTRCVYSLPHSDH